MFSPRWTTTQNGSDSQAPAPVQGPKWGAETTPLPTLSLAASSHKYKSLCLQFLQGRVQCHVYFSHFSGLFEGSKVFKKIHLRVFAQV